MATGEGDGDWVWCCVSRETLTTAPRRSGRGGCALGCSLTATQRDDASPNGPSLSTFHVKHVLREVAAPSCVLCDEPLAGRDEVSSSEGLPGIGDIRVSGSVNELPTPVWSRVAVAGMRDPVL
jgi:hypothetical protein